MAVGEAYRRIATNRRAEDGRRGRLGHGAPSWSRASRSPAKRASIRWPRRRSSRPWPRRWSVSSARVEAGFSPQSRLQDMDEQGVDVQILYPTFAGQMLGREFRDTKLLAACCRAYNNWAIEYCSANTEAPARAAILPMQDVEKASRRRIARRGMGAVSFYVRPNPVDGSHALRRLLPAAVDARSKSSACRFRLMIRPRPRCRRSAIG